MVKPPSNPVLPQTCAAWRAWLIENHARAQDVWRVFLKNGAGRPRITYAEFVGEALCFGRIDRKPYKPDSERSMLWVAPRKSGTGRSRVNKERIRRLMTTDLVHPPGLVKVKQAEADGSWTALDAVEDLEVPSDLATALAHFPMPSSTFRRFLAP